MTTFARRLRAGRTFLHVQWHVAARSRAKRRLLEVRDAYNDPIAAIYTVEADARLMAAAPAMLRVLKLAVGSLATFESRGLMTASDAEAPRLARATIAGVRAVE